MGPSHDGKRKLPPIGGSFRLGIIHVCFEGLFVSDGFDGVHVGSFLGRDVAEEDADEHTDEE